MKRGPSPAPVALGALLATVVLIGLPLLVPGMDDAPGAAGGTGTASAQRPAPGPSDPRAVSLLWRTTAAADTVARTGTRVATSWSRTGTTRYVADVTHDPETGTAVREAAPGPLEPDSYALSSAHASPVSADDRLSALLRSYQLTLGRGDTVVGRAATTIEVRRPAGTGAEPVAARLWIDDETGLLLRREVYDGIGRTVRYSSWTTLTVDPDAAPAPADAPMLPQPWRREVPSAELAAWRSAGGACPESLPDGLRLVGASRTGAESGPMAGIVHLSYTDGMSTVSVFEQRGRLDLRGLADHRPEQWGGRTVHATTGTPRQLTWSADGMVYTVVADAPDDAVDAVIAALPHDDGAPGAGTRMRRGLGRVASWVTPFG